MSINQQFEATQKYRGDGFFQSTLVWIILTLGASTPALTVISLMMYNLFILFEKNKL